MSDRFADLRDGRLWYERAGDGFTVVGSGLNGFDDRLTAQEGAELERLNEPVAEAMEAGDVERAERARLRIWAPLGTDDDAGDGSSRSRSTTSTR